MKKSQATQEALQTIKEKQKTATEIQKKTKRAALKKFMQNRVVPFIANVILVALAFKGAMQFLPTLNSSQQMAGALVVVALLAYVAYNRT